MNEFGDININALNGIGVEKESVSVASIELKRFDIKTETKLLKKLSKIFNESKNMLSEKEILNLEEVKVIDISQISMIIAKTTEAKLALMRFIDKEDNKNYSARASAQIDKTLVEAQAKDLYRTNYDVNYIKKYIDALSVVDKNILLTVKKDVPLRLENKHFIVYIAPKMMEQ